MFDKKSIVLLTKAIMRLTNNCDKSTEESYQQIIEVAFNTKLPIQLDIILPDSISFTRWNMIIKPLLRKMFTNAGIDANINIGTSDTRSANIIERSQTQNENIKLGLNLKSPVSVAMQLKTKEQGILTASWYKSSEFAPNSDAIYNVALYGNNANTTNDESVGKLTNNVSTYNTDASILTSYANKLVSSTLNTYFDIKPQQVRVDDTCNPINAAVNAAVAIAVNSAVNTANDVVLNKLKSKFSSTISHPEIKSIISNVISQPEIKSIVSHAISHITKIKHN